MQSALPALRAPADGCRAGDGRACAQVADALAQACYDGSGPACDWLHDAAAQGTDLSGYGATCGYRFETLEHAGACASAF